VPSNSQVNAAGEEVRRFLQDQEADIPFDALDIIRAFRAQHAQPLQRVAANLRYYVEHHSTGRPIVVGQRLKRMTTVADKLCRQPKMGLARMHDIGGCRAVVNTEAEIRAIVTHVRRRWEVVRGYDYIAETEGPQRIPCLPSRGR
jgi:putative GTP pyrophosphokinase